MKKIVTGAALAVVLTGCAELTDDDNASRSNLLESWRASTILGGGDGQSRDRRQGRVTGGQIVEAGQGTIYPGRQPLFRDSDFVNSNGERTVSLNLINVSVAEAAAAILGELLSENYVLDPAVSGTVNIRSTRPVSRTTAIEVFELALKQNGAALVRRDDVFAVVPISGDLTVGTTTARDVLPGYTIRVIPLNNIGAQEMAAILQPFAGSGIVGIDAQRNIIVLAGTSADQRSWQSTIDSFDVDWLASRSVGIFPIKGRSAQSIVNGLELVVETDEAFEPLVVFEVIPENNSILAVAKTPRALENTAVWIKRLTQEGQNDAQVYSYDMKYARASDIAPILSQILGIDVQEASDDADASEVVQASMQTGGDLNATRIVANEATNTLLVYGPHDEYQRVLGILHRLDVPPRQVLVEATIVEVQLNDQLRYGVQYFLEEDGDSLGLTRNDEAVSPIAPQLPGFTAIFGGDEAPEVVIDALDDLTEVNVISSPNLMILNNQSARLVVGDQIPTSIETAQDASDNNDIFVSTVEYRDTGVIFEVTPRINSSGAVILDISQEISSVGENDASTGNPIISQRVINSSVAVDSGETIALGGLFEKSRTRGNAGVPVLKDIPVAGRLFGRTSRTDSQTELLVLITPRIVNDRMDARRVTRQLRNRVQQLRLDDASLSTQINVPSLATENSAAVSRQQTAPVAPAVASAPLPQAVASRAPGRYFAHLGAFSSQSAAQAHWSTLASGNPQVLGGLSPQYSRSGRLFSVSVGPFSRQDATKICVDLKTDCYTTTRD